MCCPCRVRVSTDRFPSISSERRLDMVNPRPVPPNLRVVEESAWVKLSKIDSTLSFAIPIPVSLTEIVTSSIFLPCTLFIDPCCTVTKTSPSLVNLMALPTRLINICRILTESPKNWAGNRRVDMTDNLYVFFLCFNSQHIMLFLLSLHSIGMLCCR